MTTLTSRERIMRIFRNQQIDRPSLKLWGATMDLNMLHPAYQPIQDLAWELTDIYDGFHGGIDLIAGANNHLWELTEVPTADPNWVEHHTVLHTPKGDLYQIYQFSTIGEPGYMIRYLVQDEEDLEKLASVPYEPVHFTQFDALELRKAKLGEKGVVMINLPHAGFALQCQTGSENLAYFSVDCRELVDSLIGTYAARLLDYVKEIIAQGITDTPFAWCGPELLTPPLLTPQDFMDFCYKYDKPLCDAIHDGGNYVWVHCHGKVAKLLDAYIDMGVDVLNPLEPPKNGDIHLSADVAKYGNRIGWEGNIEIQDILLSSKEEVRRLISECVDAGAPSGRFILCPSAGYMEYPQLTEHYLENLKEYLRFGYECVEKWRK